LKTYSTILNLSHNVVDIQSFIPNAINKSTFIPM